MGEGIATVIGCVVLLTTVGVILKLFLDDIVCLAASALFAVKARKVGVTEAFTGPPSEPEAGTDFLALWKA